MLFYGRVLYHSELILRSLSRLFICHLTNYRGRRPVLKQNVVYGKPATYY